MQHASPTFETRPLYLQVHSRLIGFIIQGDWKPGQMIPNEVELARDFGVSVGTMRKALQTLTEQGLLKRRQGRGTYVTEVESRYGASLDNFRTTNHEPLQWRVLSVSLTSGVSTDDEAEGLECSTGEPVFRIRRVQLDEISKSTMLEQCCVTQRRFAGLDRDTDAHSLPIASLARRYGLLIAPGAERVDLIVSKPEQAKALNIAAGTALLRLMRTAKCFDGIPVDFRIAYCALKPDTVYENRIR